LSRVTSPVTGRSYGLATVCRVWRLARSGVYRHLAPAPAAPPPKAAAPVVPLVRPGPPAAKKKADAGESGPAGTAPEGSDEGAKRSRSRRRPARERRSKQVGRYLVCVHVQPHMTQIAMLEGRTLVEHYVSRAADDTSQIDGNVYRGRVQNVLPGMEAAFVDIGIPKNAVLYRGDVRYDRDDIEGGASSSQPRIEDVLKAGQTILCQVTKNPIGAKGARLTQEVSLPGRFAVLVPNSSAFGISKRLGDNEDVREEDRRVEGKPPDRLQRDLHGQLRRSDHLQESVPRLDLPVFGQVAPRLAHDPDGRAGERLARASGEESFTGVHHSTAGKPLPLGPGGTAASLFLVAFGHDILNDLIP